MTGASPYGGIWDHGWHSETAEQAHDHARRMFAHDDVAWVHIEERIVETEIVDEQWLGENP